MVDCPIPSARLSMYAFPTLSPPLTVRRILFYQCPTRPMHSCIDLLMRAICHPHYLLSPVVPHHQATMLAQRGHILYQENRCIDARLR
jgi:hypothetical protein